MLTEVRDGGKQANKGREAKLKKYRKCQIDKTREGSKDLEIDCLVLFLLRLLSGLSLLSVSWRVLGGHVLVGSLEELEGLLLEGVDSLLDRFWRLVFLVLKDLLGLSNLFREGLAFFLWQLVGVLSHLGLGIVNDSFGLVDDFNELSPLGILSSVLLSFLNHVLDLVLGKSSGRLNNN